MDKISCKQICVELYSAGWDSTFARSDTQNAQTELSAIKEFNDGLTARCSLPRFVERHRSKENKILNAPICACHRPLFQAPEFAVIITIPVIILFCACTTRPTCLWSQRLSFWFQAECTVTPESFKDTDW